MTKPTLSSRAYLIIDREGQITLPFHPDHLTIEPFNNLTIGIDQIRDLIHWIYLKPFSKNQKIAVIREAQQMTAEAQNALLKVLEEPPERTIILLSADDPENLLPTVRSRCLRVRKLEDLTIGGLEKEDWKIRKLETLKSSSQIIQSSNHPLKSSNLPIIQSSISQFFQLAEELSKKERAEIIDFLNSWTLSLRQTLLQNPNATTLDQLKKIKYTRKVLGANVNKRLALENLFLSLK